MNARKSLVLWIIGCVVFAGVVLGFAHGAQLTDTDALRGAAWMGGSLVVMGLEVFAAIKLMTKK
jgi:hypothetical protein